MKMKEEMLGLCGMNCNICECYLASAYDVNKQGLRARYCKGCKSRNGKVCGFVKKCKSLSEHKNRFCYECDTTPCANLQKLDKRYRAFYHMSMIENLEYIKDNGIEKFLAREEDKWKCSQCGGVISCHNGICYGCGVNDLKAVEKVRLWTKGKK